jgi:WD40 repeat protein
VKITAHYGEVSALAVDGANIFSGSLDNTIRRWDYKDVIQEHKCIEVLEPMVENLMTEEEERELAELMGL